MKLLRLALIASLLTFVFACSDNDNEIRGGGDNKDGEEQIDEAISTLEKETDLTTFTEALKNVDGSTLEGNEFTLLAYKDQKETKATATKDANTLRHMIAGKYTQQQMKEKKKIVAISKDTLYFGEEDGSLTVNNVKIGKSITSGNSVIFVVDSIIPIVAPWTPQPKEKYEFVVYNLNSKWSAGANAYESLAGNVDIQIYRVGTDSMTRVEVIKTNSEGKVLFEATEGNYCYSVLGNPPANIYYDFIVGGLFTKQSEVDSYPVYEENTGFQKGLGGLIIVDVNGDGVINSNDRVGNIPIPISSSSTQIYLMPLKDIIQAEYARAYETYRYEIDTDTTYTSRFGRMKVSIDDPKLYNLWSQSYEAIRLINRGLEELTEDIKPNLYRQRADLYLNLSAAFGNIPLQTKGVLDSKMAQSTQKEAFRLTIADYESALIGIAETNKVDTWNKLALAYRATGEYEAAINNLLAIHDSGLLSSVSAMRVFLLTADTYLTLGNKAKAIEYFNLIPNNTHPLAGDTSQEDIAYAIKSHRGWAPYYAVQLLNQMHWNNMSGWGQYSLLPIPSKAIDDKKTGALKQNPYW